MNEEVRRALKDLLDVGAIRKSSSSYCTNVVKCRKSERSLRFRIDLRKVPSRTIKVAFCTSAYNNMQHELQFILQNIYFVLHDARYTYPLPRIEDTIDRYWDQVELKEK